ncbi:hypothetical protein [Sphingomonas abietis]|uniref:Fimbrial assembly protein n=1 Tax=Sphingomonas abietis TaxID=3012344 RepID=A0ABY7NRF9_9SPHN|nr:hypothetical protein [Sphingomonas abietis]WBO23385.1 hypothetical protein PBT88_04435 [Sphingomonas abietis]
MTIATRFRTVGSAACVAVAALGCYLVSLQVAAERARVADTERGLLTAQQDIRTLQTELNTRSRLVQLERWNADVLSLTAPKAHQYLAGEMQLASLAAPMPTQSANGAPDASGLQVAPAVAQVAYRRAAAVPTTRLVHSVSLDLDAPTERPVLHRASLTIPGDEVVAYLDRGGKPPRP